MLAQESEDMALATKKLLEVSADEMAQAYALSRDSVEYARKADEHARKKQEQEARELEKKWEEDTRKWEEDMKKAGEEVKKAQEEIMQVRENAEKAKRQEKLVIAKNLLEMGISTHDVSKGTGLDLAEVSHLRSRLEVEI